MRLLHACWSVPLAVAATSFSPAGKISLAEANPEPVKRGVAYFEPPKSIGTPIDEVARDYTGLGLADKIAGRLRLDTDASLDAVTRNLIRRRLANRG
jgi:hypothetical protein